MTLRNKLMLSGAIVLGLAATGAYSNTRTMTVQPSASSATAATDEQVTEPQVPEQPSSDPAPATAPATPPTSSPSASPIINPAAPAPAPQPAVTPAVTTRTLISSKDTYITSTTDPTMQDVICVYEFSDGSSANKTIGRRPVPTKNAEGIFDCPAWTE